MAGLIGVLALWPVQLLAEKAQLPPSMEFLEFLGDAANEEGEWIDPLQMQDLAMGENSERIGNPQTEVIDDDE